jgi:hypothetical protein
MNATSTPLMVWTLKLAGAPSTVTALRLLPP